MSRKDKPTYVRLPADLKTQLETAAQENSRSICGEIVHRLKKSLAEEGRVSEVSEVSEVSDVSDVSHYTAR